MLNVAETRWNFYESMENGSRESMADYFETLYHHYKQRGKLLNKLNKKLKGEKECLCSSIEKVWDNEEDEHWNNE